MQDLRCSITNPSALTVGQIFTIDCDAAPGITEKSHAKFILKDEYLLQVTKLQITDHVQLFVRSDRVGEQKVESPILEISGGAETQTYKTPDLSWKVQSVQSQTEPRKDPYPPHGSLRFAFPMGFFLLCFLALCLVIAGLIWNERRKRKNRQILKRLESEAGGVDPLTQLYKNLRLADLDLRKLDAVSAQTKMRDAFELFLQRNFDRVFLRSRAVAFFKRVHAEHYYWIWERLSESSLDVAGLEELREAILRHAEEMKRRKL